jgi:hypothetical protein
MEGVEGGKEEEGGGKEEEGGMHTYILLVDGYSIISNIGFCKIDISSGTSKMDACLRAYDKIGVDLFVNYNISIREMMTTECRLFMPNDTISNSNSNSNSNRFAFYALCSESIQAFREDEERYLIE